jgi:hypothetical protein
MNSNHKKFLKYFFNIGYHATSHLAKHELKAELVRREKERKILLVGK